MILLFKWYITSLFLMSQTKLNYVLLIKLYVSVEHVVVCSSVKYSGVLF